jgi:sulfur dioxygenase
MNFASDAKEPAKSRLPNAFTSCALRPKRFAIHWKRPFLAVGLSCRRISETLRTAWVRFTIWMFSVRRSSLPRPPLQAYSSTSSCGGIHCWESSKGKKSLKPVMISRRVLVYNLRMSFLFRQLFEAESSTYTYLLGDSVSKEAVIIDPVAETIDRDLQLVRELGLKLKFALDTHIHADHVTASGEIRARSGCKIAVIAGFGIKGADLEIHDGDLLSFGPYKLKVLETPGHTDTCLSFLCEGRVFSGDALMIRTAGRTDFQQGSPEKLYDSVHKKLFSLPRETLVYPAHDYKGMTVSTVGEEIDFNCRLGKDKSREDFVRIMKELRLPDPKKMGVAVPANMSCGLK